MAASGGGGKKGDAERYERAGVDKRLECFFDRLSDHPDQTLRYSWPLDAIWPAAEPPVPPPCSRCGSRRVPEVQLMSPILYFLGLDVVSDEQEVASAEQCKGGLDFSTAVVYSCEQSCVGEDPYTGEVIRVLSGL